MLNELPSVVSEVFINAKAELSPTRDDVCKRRENNSTYSTLRIVLAKRYVSFFEVSYDCTVIRTSCSDFIDIHLIRHTLNSVYRCIKKYDGISSGGDG